MVRLVLINYNKVELMCRGRRATSSCFLDLFIFIFIVIEYTYSNYYSVKGC